MSFLVDLGELVIATAVYLFLAAIGLILSIVVIAGVIAVGAVALGLLVGILA